MKSGFLAAAIVIVGIIGIANADVITEALFDTSSDPTKTTVARAVVITKPTVDGTAIMGTPETPFVVSHDTPQFVKLTDSNGNQPAISSMSPSDAEKGLAVHARLWATGPTNTQAKVQCDGSGRLLLAPVSTAARVLTGGLSNTVNNVTQTACTNETQVNIQIVGPFVGTVAFEATADGFTWQRLALQRIDGSAASTTTTTPGIFQGPLPGVQVRCVWDGATYVSGSPAVTILTRSSGE